MSMPSPIRMNDSQTNTWPVLPAAVSDVPRDSDAAELPEPDDPPRVTVVVPPEVLAATAVRVAPTAIERRPRAKREVWATRAMKAMAVVTVPMSTR